MQTGRWFLALVVALAACGGGGQPHETDAAPAPDARPAADAGDRADAAGPDHPDAAPPAPTSPPAFQLDSAGGRVRRGALTLDVELGHGWSRRPARAGDRTVSGGAAVGP